MTKFVTIIHCDPKKLWSRTLAITLSNLNRFQKFFHCCKYIKDFKRFIENWQRYGRWLWRWLCMGSRGTFCREGQMVSRGLKGRGGWVSWGGCCEPLPTSSVIWGEQMDFVQFVTCIWPWRPRFLSLISSVYGKICALPLAPFRVWGTSPSTPCSPWKYEYNNTQLLFFCSLQKWSCRYWTIIHRLSSLKNSVAAVQTDFGDGVSFTC